MKLREYYNNARALYKDKLGAKLTAKKLREVVMKKVPVYLSVEEMKSIITSILSQEAPQFESEKAQTSLLDRLIEEVARNEES